MSFLEQGENDAKWKPEYSFRDIFLILKCFNYFRILFCVDIFSAVSLAFFKKRKKEYTVNGYQRVECTASILQKTKYIQHISYPHRQPDQNRIERIFLLSQKLSLYEIIF